MSRMDAEATALLLRVKYSTPRAMRATKEVLYDVLSSYNDMQKQLGLPLVRLVNQMTETKKGAALPQRMVFEALQFVYRAKSGQEEGPWVKTNPTLDFYNNTFP